MRVAYEIIGEKGKEMKADRINRKRKIEMKSGKSRGKRIKEERRKKRTNGRKNNGKDEWKI